MADLGKFLSVFNARGTINKVQETLTGGKAKAQFLKACGYPRQPQALMQRLAGNLQTVLPLCTSDSDISAFGAMFDGPELMRNIRSAPLNYPLAGGDKALRPWLSAQGGLQLARAARLTGEFTREFNRWLENMLAASKDLTGPGWQDNAVMSARALNLLFMIRFIPNHTHMAPELCADVLLHLHLLGQILHHELNDDREGAQAAMAGALLFLGHALDFVPESASWRQEGAARLGPSLWAWGQSGQEVYPPASLRAALQWGCLALWAGTRNRLNLPQLTAAVGKLASWLRCLAPPWVSQEFVPELGLGPLDFSGPACNGQEANCAAILLSSPEIRGPRQVSELLFWLYGAEVKERLRQLAGGEPPGALDIAALGLTSLSTRWRRRPLSVWLASGPRQNRRQEMPVPARHPLSIFIFRQGTPLLSIPGPIHKGPLAEYVQSRQAANSMVVDEQPPQNALTELEALEKRGRHLFMAASCDGYSHLPDPVMIRRRVFVDESAKLINIVDQVQSGGEHNLRIYFHFPPHAQVCKAPGSGYIITLENEKWWFKSDVRAAISLVSAQANPPLGWSAGAANAILPSPTLTLSAAIVGSTRLNCSLALLPD